MNCIYFCVYKEKLCRTLLIHIFPMFQEQREGNGNPLQCSCLENPSDGGAWWAAVYEVRKQQLELDMEQQTDSK